MQQSYSFFIIFLQIPSSLGVLEQLKADGVNVVEVTDIKPWQDACKTVIDENIKGQEELYQKIVDMQ